MNYIVRFFWKHKIPKFEFKLKAVINKFFLIIFLYSINSLNTKIYTLEPFSPEFELTYSLVKTTINEVTVLHSKSFSMSYVKKALEFIQQYYLNTDHNNIKYNISKFKRIDGSYFNHLSHLNHYNLYLPFQEFDNTLWTHQLTHKLPKLNNFDFEFFSENDIVRKNIKQYISSNIRIIDSTYIEPFNDGYVSNDDLLKFTILNKLKIIHHFESSLNIN